MTVFLLLFELILLYLLSRRVIQTLYSLLHMLTRSRTVAIWIVSIIFFPGTVVHELAHLFTAEILGVHTGKLTLVPESLEGTEIKAGGVMIAETDAFRRTVIGVAPVIWGVTLLTALSYWLPTLWQQTVNTINQGNALTDYSFYALFLVLYALFSVSNSMFSSKEDMKGVIPFVITVVLFAVAAYIAGFRFGLTGELLAKTTLVLETLVRSLGVVLIINIVFLASITSALTMTKKRS